MKNVDCHLSKLEPLVTLTAVGLQNLLQLGLKLGHASHNDKIEATAGSQTPEVNMDQSAASILVTVSALTNENLVFT